MAHRRIRQYDALTIPTGSASGLGYRMPAEFEPISCIWLTPPKNTVTWPGCLAEAQREFAGWVALLRKVVTVRTTDELGIDTNDSWIRDFGPIFVVKEGSLACHDFHFNTWGGKYEVRDKDDVAPQHIAKALDVPIWVHDFVLEGGSIDVNGRGTVMTTEQCLLNPNRNPGMSRGQIESQLHSALGTRHVIWLPGGIEGDDTDGHIDDVARFISPNMVAVVSAPKGHPDHGMTQKNITALREAMDQDSRPLRVVELPVPEPIHYDYPDGRGPVPASYANFLIVNGHVFIPIFGQPADGQAAAVLEAAMPGYSVIPVLARSLVVGLGALHCLSQQQPAVVEGPGG